MHVPSLDMICGNGKCRNIVTPNLRNMMNENTQSSIKLYKANITKVSVEAMIGIQLQWRSKIVWVFFLADQVMRLMPRQDKKSKLM